MRIKKYPNGNSYLLTPNGKWVRDFTAKGVPLLDINDTVKPEDNFLFINNEFENNIKRYAWIDTEKFYFPNVVIISDGFGFENGHRIISKIKNIENVTVIGVNGSLKKWACEKNMSFYLVNNPYEESVADLPKRRMLPRCIASCRTNFNFLSNYKGTVFRYNPVNEKTYGGKGSKEATWSVDDYRNPICAAIGIAYKFGVEKLLLMHCDESFEQERPGSVLLENGLWTYPQQIVAQELIDANMFWLQSNDYSDVKVGNFSKGIKYQFAAYIDNEEDVINFFN